MAHEKSELNGDAPKHLAWLCRETIGAILQCDPEQFFPANVATEKPAPNVLLTENQQFCADYIMRIGKALHSGQLLVPEPEEPDA